MADFASDADNRKAKLEEEQRKKFEERQKREELERRRKEEERIRAQAEEEELAKKNSEALLPPPQVFEEHHPTFDLLGGIDSSSSRGHSEVNSEVASFDGNALNWDAPKNHDEWRRPGAYRAGEQRGPIDSKFEDILDHYASDVKTVKNGKKDGVYLFGTRIVKAELNSDGEVVIPVGKDKMKLVAFLDKFSRVERLKLRGLASAAPLCNYLGQQAKSQTQKAVTN